MNDEPEPGVPENDRAIHHREQALGELSLHGDGRTDAVVHAILALEARVEELTVFVAQLQ